MRRDVVHAVLLGAVVCSSLSLVGCARSSPSSGVASGSIHCSAVKGSVDFQPPLDSTGGSAERVTVKARLSRCFTTGSSVRAVSAGTVTSTILVATNACSGLLQFPSSLGGVSTPLSSRRVVVDTKWHPASIAPTTAIFSGFSVTTNDSGSPGFAFPGVGHQAKVTGSFAGTNRGALSTAVVFTNQGVDELAAECSRPSGMASIELSSGEVTFL